MRYGGLFEMMRYILRPLTYCEDADYGFGDITLVKVNDRALPGIINMQGILCGDFSPQGPDLITYEHKPTRHLYWRV